MTGPASIELAEPPSKRLQKHVLDAKYLLLGLASSILVDASIERALDRLAVFCCFVGHGRSGGTLVGALLNAHPNVVMSNELNALRRLRLGLTGRQLERLIYLVSRRQVARGSQGGGGYTYAVPNQWQGRHHELKVIGDRKAGATAHEILLHPESLDTLQRKIGLAKKFIHVVRNPFDTITTTYRKTSPLHGESVDAHLNREVRNYFARCAAVARIEVMFGTGSIHFLYHERLTSDPHGELQRTCEFLEVESFPDYLNDCASIIRATPHESRKTLIWTERQSAAVLRGMADFHWLADYHSSR
jgi:hypothetical protein